MTPSCSIRSIIRGVMLNGHADFGFILPSGGIDSKPVGKGTVRGLYGPDLISWRSFLQCSIFCAKI